MIRLLFVASGIVYVMACSARPERPDPADFPSATDADGEVPIPNTCTTLTHVFDVAASGYLEDSYAGYATYEYRGSPENRSSVYLQACDGEEPADQFLALHFFGVARIDPGSYDVTRLAQDDGGFLFSFTDNGIELSCSDLPTGRVEIVEADFERVEGTFTIDARCVDEDLIGRIPRDAHFSGTFSASNVGRE